MRHAERLVVFATTSFSQPKTDRSALELARLIVETLELLHGFIAPELGVLHCRFQNADRLVVDLDRYGIRTAVLTAVRQRKTRRVLEAVWRAVHDLGDHSERLHRARADTRRQQQLREVDRPAFGGRSERAVQAPREHVGRLHVMMGRHDEVW